MAAFSIIPESSAQDKAPDLQVSETKAAVDSRQGDWVETAIALAQFIEDNDLVIRPGSYEAYEKHVLKAPSQEKLDRLYELLIDAMFIRSQDVTEKYMPIYLSEIEKTASIEHRQSLTVLTTATKAYNTNWTYAEAISVYEVVTTIQKLETLTESLPYNIFLDKQLNGLKEFSAVYTNDPEAMVKYAAKYLQLSYEAKSPIYGFTSSANVTHLVMKYGDVAAIDRIDAINQRIAHLSGDNLSIFSAYTSCGESAVKLVRNMRALNCLGEARNYEVKNTPVHIRYNLYSAISFARDGQVEQARTYLERVKNIPDVETSLFFKRNIDWASSEVLQAEGHYVEAYKGLRSYFNTRVASQNTELGEVSKSLRVYGEEKAALLQEKTTALASKEALQKRVISRQRILILLSALLVSSLWGFVYLQRQNSKKLAVAREEAVQAGKALKYEARTDQLTRIGNRRAFYDYCTVISEKPGHQSFTLAILDLDGFKQVNDTFGHETGDRLIQETSRRLSRALAGRGQVFRLGGDEFAIMFQQTHDDDFSHFKSCLSKALKDPVQLEMKRLDLNYSVGAVQIAGERLFPRSFLNQADYALYQAKTQEGPSFHIFTDTDFENMNLETRLAEEVVWNLQTASFTMFGQVIVKSVKGQYQPFGVEALIRAQTREGKIIRPDAFVWHAVSSGEADLFTKISLRKSIEMLKASDIDCPLLFNLSREQITSANVLDIVLDVLDATNFPANNLIIELSERTLNHDLSTASKALNAFKSRGIRIALDDFGAANTGFSSFLEFDFDLIKTDRNLLCSAMELTRTEYLMSNLIELSRKLNVPCVIEGLETLSEVSFIENLGGNILQGYIFGRPEENPKFRSHLNWSETRSLEEQAGNQTLPRKIA